MRFYLAILTGQLMLGCAAQPPREVRVFRAEYGAYIDNISDLKEPNYGVACKDWYNPTTAVAGPFSIMNECEFSPQVEKIRDERKAAMAMLLKKQPYAKYKKQIKDNSVVIGMPKEIVALIMGQPDDINRTITASGTVEQWIYGDSKYIYFTNNKVTALQD